MGEMSTFIYVLKLTRPEMFEKMSAEDEAVVEAHFKRLRNALTKGRLILAGPCLDGEFGIVVFRADSEKEAKQFMENDPTVKRGIMTAKLHPFRVSLIEKAGQS